MPNKKKTVTFKVPSIMREAIDEMISLELYKSRTEVVVEAIKKLLENEDHGAH